MTGPRHDRDDGQVSNSSAGNNRKRMTGKERREQLLDIGRRLFAERGFEGTSIEEIAAQAGVSKPVVYEHFGGKEGLYAVVVDRELKDLLVHLAQTLDGAVALVSGRSIDVMDRLFAPLQLPAAGLHGLERRTAAGVPGSSMPNSCSSPNASVAFSATRCAGFHSFLHGWARRTARAEINNPKRR